MRASNFTDSDGGPIRVLPYSGTISNFHLSGNVPSKPFPQLPRGRFDIVQCTYVHPHSGKSILQEHPQGLRTILYRISDPAGSVGQVVRSHILPLCNSPGLIGIGYSCDSAAPFIFVRRLCCFTASLNPHLTEPSSQHRRPKKYPQTHPVNHKRK